MLNSFQNLHNIGYTHNDIKPGNIMIDIAPDNRSQIKTTLIDFGFSHGFLSSSGKHLKMDDVETFQGNLSFSSLQQMSFKTTSRRDDLISLTYLMLSLLNRF
jgi:serine/threonine protein kinase